MKKSLSLRKIHAYIKKTNVVFKKMSGARKRAQIAKDVLMQLDQKRIKPLTGRYLEVPSRIEDAIYSRSQEDMQEVFAKMETCAACAIGAVFVAAVERLDNLPTSALHGSSSDDATMRMYLQREGVFTAPQSTLLEKVFEGYGVYANQDKWNTRDYADTRMRAIMNAVIKARGVVRAATFKHLVQR